MQVRKTALDGVLLIQPERYSDDRGWFQESWQAQRFSTAIGRDVVFVQDNLSRSKHGVLRGLHLQTGAGQGKLVSVLEGTIFDVAVDARPSSSTFGQYISLALDAVSGQQLWLPEGIAHGFLVTSKQAQVHYKVTDFYCATAERVLHYADSACAIRWPLTQLCTAITVSDKDQQGLSWAAFKEQL